MPKVASSLSPCAAAATKPPAAGRPPLPRQLLRQAPRSALEALLLRAQAPRVDPRLPQAGGQLAQPSLLRLVRPGQLDGLPLRALELLPHLLGRDLRALERAAQLGRLAPRDVELAPQLPEAGLQAAQLAHGRGLVAQLGQGRLRRSRRPGQGAQWPAGPVEGLQGDPDLQLRHGWPAMLRSCSPRSFSERSWPCSPGPARSAGSGMRPGCCSCSSSSASAPPWPSWLQLRSPGSPGASYRRARTASGPLGPCAQRVGILQARADGVLR